jgi:hypothetical protein
METPIYKVARRLLEGKVRDCKRCGVPMGSSEGSIEHTIDWAV